MKLPIRWILSTIFLVALVAPSGTAIGEGPADERGDRSLHLGTHQVDMLTSNAYTVEVDCDFDERDNLTECAFSGITPRDASDIRRLTVPAELICTDVVDGDFVRIELEDGRDGYASEDDEDELELEFRGRVTTGGTATYEVAIIGKVFPAEGPALSCDQGQGEEASGHMTATVTTPGPTLEAADVTETPATSTQETSTETPASSTQNATTGTLVVATFSCANVPEDTRAFDWLGECTPGAGPLGFNIDNVNDTRMGERAVGTNGNTGEAVFEEVPPGTYKLSSGRGEPSWCHASSDSVNADGHVVIEGGDTVTVWTFYCEAGGS